MEIDFDLIIELQRLDSEIHNASLVLEGIPRLVQDVDKKIQATTKLVADAKDKMAQNQKKRRDLESEVKDLKVAIGKYKRQLNEVKTNKEYTSLLHEIEETQHKIDTLEEGIIAEMLAADDVEEAIKAALHKQSPEEDLLKKEKIVLDEKMKETEARFAALAKEREALAPQDPPRAAPALRGPPPEEGRHRPIARHGGFLRHVPHARPPADAQRDPGQGEGHPLRELRPDPLLAGQARARQGRAARLRIGPAPRVSRRSPRRRAPLRAPPCTGPRWRPGIRP